MDNKNSLELLEMDEGKIYLDGKEEKNMVEFGFKKLLSGNAEITIKKIVKLKD